MIMTLPPMVLTEAETAVRAAFGRGERQVLGPVTPDDQPWLALAGDTRRIIRASVIRDLLLSDAHIAPGQLRQLDIFGADIRGPLDLRFARIDCPLRFTHCTFDSPLTLSEADLRSVSMRWCTAPGLDARHLRVTGDLSLEHTRLTGPLLLAGAHLADDLHLASATIVAGDADPAVDLGSIHVKGKVDATGLTAYGMVSMNGAVIDGVLTMTRAKIHAGKADRAWDGDGMIVGGELDATGLHTTGRIRLIDARILNVVLRDLRAEVQPECSGGALVLDRLESRGSVFCDGDTMITGGIHAIGIQVGASLYLNHAMVRIPDGSATTTATGGAAVNLRRAKIACDLRCGNAFQSIGEFDLTGARIGGQVSLSGAALRADGAADDRAFTADRCEIGRDFCCDQGFTAAGTMSLQHAVITGDMILDLSGQDEDAPFTLKAQGVRVARDVELRAPGRVDLGGAAVGGDVTLDLARLRAPDKKAAADLSTASAGVLTLRGTQRGGVLDLTRTSVALLLDDPDHRPAGSPVVLDGFSYGDIERPAAEALRYRLAWLRAGTTLRKTPGGYQDIRFTPQPYTQLAEACRRAGEERDSRWILCHMHRARNAAGSWRRLHSKIWNWLQDLFLGYGYVPSRALLWIAVLSALTAAWFLNNDPQHISIVEAGILSLGLILPGTGYDKIEEWTQMSTVSHLIAAALILCGLLLGATVLAAVARVIKR